MLQIAFLFYSLSFFGSAFGLVGLFSMEDVRHKKDKQTTHCQNKTNYNPTVIQTTKSVITQINHNYYKQTNKVIESSKCNENSGFDAVSCNSMSCLFSYPYL